jgi:hypothetical protein
VSRWRNKFLIVVFTITFLALNARFLYIVCNDFKQPQRKEVRTFTRIKWIDNWMLLWPFIGILAAFFKEFDKHVVIT